MSFVQVWLLKLSIELLSRVYSTINESIFDHLVGGLFYFMIIMQCSLWALEKDLEGSTLVVGGDGRFFMTECTEIIIR